MGNVIRAFEVITMEHKRQLEVMEQRLIEAITDAKRAGVPQGLIVALLHGYASNETAAMMDVTTH